MTVNQLDTGTQKGTERLLLAVALLLPVVAELLLQTVLARVLPLLLLGVAECMLWVVWAQLRNADKSARQRVLELEQALIGQQVIDTESGAAQPYWFAQVLETECRRAVREFTQLTVMQVEVTSDSDSLQLNARNRLAQVLTNEVSRSGDLLGLTSDGNLQLLLPSTNEHSIQLAERIVEKAQHVLGTTDVRVAVCTLQPQADLNAEKVRGHLLPLVEQMRNGAAGTVTHFAEAIADEQPSTPVAV